MGRMGFVGKTGKRQFAKLLLGLTLAVLVAAPAGAGGSGTMINKGPDNVAILGYDMVAYFAEGRPMQGSPGICVQLAGC